MRKAILEYKTCNYSLRIPTNNMKLSRTAEPLKQTTKIANTNSVHSSSDIPVSKHTLPVKDVP